MIDAANWLVRVHQALLALSVWVLVASVALAAIKKLRGVGSLGILVSSLLLGLSTWAWGAGITLGVYGTPGFVIGVAMLGIGVVPIAIFAAFFTLKVASLGLGLVAATAATGITSTVGGYGVSVAREARAASKNAKEPTWRS